VFVSYSMFPGRPPPAVRACNRDPASLPRRTQSKGGSACRTPVKRVLQTAPPCDGPHGTRIAAGERTHQHIVVAANIRVPANPDDAIFRDPAMDGSQSLPGDSANLLGDLRSPTARPGLPAPVELEAGAVPADHGIGFHEDQDVRPARPKLAKRRPEESVQEVQFRPRPFPFQHVDLLSESEEFEGGIAATA
jgi:hypothetical protein